MDTFYFKEVIGLEDAGNVFRDNLSGKLHNDQKVDSVAVFAKNVFGQELQQVCIIAKFDFYGASDGLMPVNMMFMRGRNC